MSEPKLCLKNGNFCRNSNAFTWRTSWKWTHEQHRIKVLSKFQPISTNTHLVLFSHKPVSKKKGKILHQPEKCAVPFLEVTGGFTMKMSNGCFVGAPPPKLTQQRTTSALMGVPVKLVIFDRYFRLGNVSGKIRPHFHPGSSWNIKDPLLIPHLWFSLKRPRNLTKLEDPGISVPASQMQGLPSAARVMCTNERFNKINISQCQNDSKCVLVSQFFHQPGHFPTARLWLLRLFVTGLLTTFALHWALAGNGCESKFQIFKKKQTNSF